MKHHFPEITIGESIRLRSSSYDGTSKDGVDFPILAILKTTRKARSNIWFSFTTKVPEGIRFLLLSLNRRFINLLKGWLWVHRVTHFIFVAGQNCLVKLFRLANCHISHNTSGLQHPYFRSSFFQTYRILRNYQKFLTIFVRSIIINNINVMLSK